MIKENEGRSIRDYGNRKKKDKRIRNIVISVLFLVFAAMGIAYLLSIYNRNYQSYEVLKTVDNTGESTVGYLSYGSAVVKYSRDGAVAIDKDGSILWNGSYEMMNPITDTCGKYVVIADKDNKSIQIFDEKGLVGGYTTQYDIKKVEIAAQGVVVALMDGEEANYIMLYGLDGTVLGDVKKYINNDGYPIDIALSNDGQKMVISFLSFAKGELISKVAFYNFGEVGQNYTSNVVGGFEFKDMILPRVTFLGNDTVCSYKENGFLIFSMIETPNMIHEENLEGKIQSILNSDKYTGVVLKAGEASPKQLLLYNLKGEKILDKVLDFDYDKIFLTGEEIIMYDNLTCLVMKMNGQIKFKYTFDGNVAAFFPINDLDRYFLINETKISEILLVE